MENQNQTTKATTPEAPEAPSAPEAPPANTPENQTDETAAPLPKSVPPYLHGNAKPETVAKWAKTNLDLTLPETMTKEAMLRAVNAKLKNHHHQLEATAASATTDPETEALPPGEGGEPAPAQPLPGHPERFTRTLDGAAPAKGGAPASLKGVQRAIGVPGRKSEATLRDSDPRIPEAVAALRDDPSLSHLAPATDEDGRIDPEVAASLELLPKNLLIPPSKAFRHPQVCNWLYNPETNVYWYPTELLMRNENMIPVMGEPPKGAVFGSLPPQRDDK